MSEVSAVLAEPPSADRTDTSTALVDGLAEMDAKLRQASGLYARWRSHPAAVKRWPDEPWGGPEDERLRDDLRGIDFWAMEETSARFAALARAAEALAPLVTSAGEDLQDGPRSQVNEGAAMRLADYVKALRAWQDGAGQLAASVDGARRTVAAVVERWAEDTKATDSRVDDAALRNGHIDLVDAALAGGETPATLRTPGIPLGAEPATPSGDALAWLDEFAARYAAETARLRRGLRATREAVEQVWQVFGQVLAEVPADPFAGLVPAPPSDDPQVVIRDGDRTVVLTGPDEQGRYLVTIDGKTYPLDFTDGPVRFTDGGTAVTATLVEDGKVAISLDDGSGPPTTYTVDTEPDEPKPEPEPTDPPSKPSADGSGGGGSGPGGGSGGGSGPGPGGGPAAPTAGATPLAEGASMGAEAQEAERRAPAAAGAAAAGDGSGGGGRGGGGMPMGMGAMGGGAGGQGGDSERKGSTWKIAGNLFEDRDPASGFDGVIGVDPAARK